MHNELGDVEHSNEQSRAAVIDIHLDCIGMSRCVAKLLLFGRCMKQFMADALFESEDLASHDYMTLGFFESCLSTYFDVLEEFGMFRRPTVVKHVLEYNVT